MNVGDYVRTKDIGIQKICKMISDTSFYTEDGYEVENNVIKSSLNIIDLIEETDIIQVNGMKYEVGATNYFSKNKEMELCIYDWDGRRFLLKDIIIEEILTHEQYENNCYRVERK